MAGNVGADMQFWAVEVPPGKKAKVRGAHLSAGREGAGVVAPPPTPSSGEGGGLTPAHSHQRLCPMGLYQQDAVHTQCVGTPYPYGCDVIHSGLLLPLPPHSLITTARPRDETRSR